jgi:ADP-heptose:LPS heptosyltransferase
MLIASAVLPDLRASGYKIAFMAKGSRAGCVEHDPHIDHLIKIPDDFSVVWTEFMDVQRKQYDRVVMLSDTIETTLVARTESPIWNWEPIALRAMCSDVSYLERVFALVGARTPARAPIFYPTHEERVEAENYRDGMKGEIRIGIQIAGSAIDKAYPHYGRLVVMLQKAFDCSVMLFGSDGVSDRELLEYALVTVRQWGDFSRVKNSSKKSLRWGLSLAQHLDVMIGPDTGVMWAVSGNPKVHKVSLLGHATPKNITHLWTNTKTMHADQAKVGCWPCHRLHGDLTHCTPDPSGKWSACISSIRPEEIVDHLKAHFTRGS